MAIVNRDLDVSEQKQPFAFSLNPLNTGITAVAVVIPTPGILAGVQVKSQGLSGSPVVSCEILRFNAGAGITGILLGATVAVAGVGTSGPQTYALPSQGSSLVQVLAGDMIVFRNLVANSAVALFAGTVVIKATQDIKSYQGSSS